MDYVKPPDVFKDVSLTLTKGADKLATSFFPGRAPLMAMRRDCACPGLKAAAGGAS